jgi:drug/metabolite transporter (DMT)-like permease
VCFLFSEDCLGEPVCLVSSGNLLLMTALSIRFFGLSGMYCSLQYLSLSTATVITFLAPFSTAIVGALLLKESLALRELAAGGLSLVGVVLIARPPFLFGSTSSADDDGTTPAQRMLGVTIGLVGVIGATGAYVSIRAIGKRASAMHSIASFALQCVIFSIPLSPITNSQYVVPSNPTFFLLLPAVGICGFIAQSLLTMGLQRETAGRGAVGLYTQILFAVVLQWAVFGTLPRGWSVVGMIIVVGSALYVAVGVSSI